MKEFKVKFVKNGKEIDSCALSEYIEKIHTGGKSKIDFVIGGSLGVSEALMQRSNERQVSRESDKAQGVTFQTLANLNSRQAQVHISPCAFHIM